jgi:lipoprotein-releasing system permease protein
MMLPFSLALRFLRAGRGQTILITVGIAIAIAAQIFIGLLITSLQKTLVDRTIGNQPQITISPAGDAATISNWQTMLTTVRETGLVQTAAISASGNAFLFKGTQTAPVLVRGFDAAADNIYSFNSSVYEGSWDPSQNGILMGKDLQEEFGFKVGDEVTLQTPGGQTDTVVITGFFDLGVSQLNKSWLITSLGKVQSIFGYNGDITGIEMTVADPFQADTIAAQIQAALDNSTISITNWKEQNEQLLSGLQGQSISSLMIQIFIIVSVVIAIAAILAITVFQKSRQLGILKAMGIKDRSASLIFIYEGLIIGIIGSIVGIALGLLLLYGFSIGTSQSGSQSLIDLYIDYQFIAISWVIAVLAAVIAALIPARRSLRLNPIEVIREG